MASTLTSVVAFASANAADISSGGGYKDAPYAYNWSGIYVGANGGGGWTDPSWNFPVNSFYLNNAPKSFSSDLSGGLWGGQIGFNKQVGSIVVGVEAAGDWFSWKQTKTGPLTPSFPNDKWTTKLADLETVTLRLGYAANNWLFYGKAGPAKATVSLSAVSGVPVPGVTYGESQRLWGIDTGAGVEYAITPNIIVGAEYNHVSIDAGVFDGRASNGAPVAVSNKSDIELQSVVGRVSYKFGWDYMPLK